MEDAALTSMLTHELVLKRPRVDVDTLLDPESAQYETARSAQGRVMPLRLADHVGVLGRFPEATHRIFVPVTEVRANYRVEHRIRETTLASDVLAGEDAIGLTSATGFHVGDLLEIGSDQPAARVTIVALDGSEATVEPALPLGAMQGDPVRSIALYDVLGVEDEAGAAHHLRVVARRTEA